MNLLAFVPVALATVVFTACSGGAGSKSTNSALPQSAAMATGTMTIGVAPQLATSIARKPLFISTSTTNASLFIDSVNAAIGTSTNCASGCIISYTATPGAHAFAAEIDDGSHVLAEGAHATFTLVPGNANNFIISLNGVAAEYSWHSDTGATTSTISGTYAIEDASGVLISSPGSTFDNGILTLTAHTLTGTPGATITAGSTLAGPDISGLDYTDTVSCGASASGTFNVTIAAGGRTAELTAGQLATRSSVSYPSTTLTANPTWITYTCTNGVISDAGGGGTIQSIDRAL